ncbi:MAG: DUF2752 domain-containing protein [Ruminococcaceae bacterium]|nr:DUF2752 domain-containing protein [Oscillospiraceae bacterium]
MRINNKKRFIFILSLGIVLVGLLFGFLAYKGIGVPCIFYKLTGLKCAGCGNTRAAIALLTLDFKGMFYYNPLFIFEMLYVARVYIVCAKNYINELGFKYHLRPDAIDIIFLVLLILWTVIRNVI